MKSLQKILIKRTTLVTLLAATVLSAPAFAASNVDENGPVLMIKNFIGTIDMINTDAPVIDVIKDDGAQISVDGNFVTIDDQQKIKHSRCKSNDSSISIRIGKKSWAKRSGYKNLSEYPHMKIHAPANTNLIISDSVIFGKFDDVKSANLEVRSCGSITLGDVAQKLDLRISGSGDVDAGNVGSADIHVSGSGDLQGDNFGPTQMRVSGSGDIEIEDIDGDVRIDISGSGDVDINDIRGSLEYNGSGSSDAKIESVRGDHLRINSSGSGDVRVSGGEVSDLAIIASGASDVSYDGDSSAANVRASGASDISIRRPKGPFQSSHGGAADIHVRK